MDNFSLFKHTSTPMKIDIRTSKSPLGCILLWGTIALLLILSTGCQSERSRKIEYLKKQREIYLQNLQQEKQPTPSCPDGYCPVRAIKQPLSYTNWTTGGRGSCAWASLSNAALAAGLPDIAKDLRSKMGGGATASQLRREIIRRGWKFLQTTDGDASILDYADKTRRAAVIWFRPGHACLFNGWLKDGSALLLDPNTNTLEILPKEKFMAEWRRQGGVATVVLSFPPGQTFKHSM